MARVFDTPVITNDQSIDRVLAAGLPVLLVFLDGPAPQPLVQTLERLAQEHAGDLLVAQVQVKENPATRQRFRVNRTPAVAAVRQGQVLSEAESVAAEGLNQHAAFLLGKGPKPAAERAAETRQTPQASRPASPQAGTGADGRPRVVTDASFDQEVLRSPRPVLVDFWAPWCGPCRMTEPIVEKLARELAGQVKVVKINVDENPLVTQRFDIRSIPTMMIFRSGQMVDRWAGALPEPAMRSRLAPFSGR